MDSELKHYQKYRNTNFKHFQELLERHKSIAVSYSPNTFYYNNELILKMFPASPPPKRKFLILIEYKYY